MSAVPPDDSGRFAFAPKPAEGEDGRSGVATLVLVLGFLAALGGGFFAGKRLFTKAPPVEVVSASTARQRVELRGDEPSLGPADAPVQVVWFSDFECPYCARAAKPFLDAAKAEGVRVVFKHYPLPFHEKAVPAARAAQAAHLQGRFWEMHDWLYESKAAWDRSPEHARSLGLEVERFRREMLSPEVLAVVEGDRKAGGEAGVSSTPTFVVNGHLYRGVQSEDAWAEIFEAEREQALRSAAPGSASP